jgi:hypothetical protein
MKTSISNLKGAVVLSKMQQKEINGGGGTCGYFYGESYMDGEIIRFRPCFGYGLTREEAQSHAAAGGGSWCCDSCASASYAGFLGFN